MLKIILNIYYNPVDELKNIIFRNKNIYVPVNGGSSLKDDQWCRDNIFFDDDCSNNISAYNKKLNELTSIWWFYQQLEKFGNPGYVGFNHYRRFFNLDDVASPDHDIYVAKPIKCGLSILSQYQYYHNIQDLATCISVMANRNGRFANEFYTYIKTHTDNFAPCNMFILKNSLFREWVEFIFPIMFDLEKKIDLSGRDNYQKRALCFLCERIFGFWCWRKMNSGCSIRELDMIERLEFKNNKLNERGTY